MKAKENVMLNNFKAKVSTKYIPVYIYLYLALCPVRLEVSFIINRGQHVIPSQTQKQISEFIKDPSKEKLRFEAMDKVARAIV